MICIEDHETDAMRTIAGMIRDQATESIYGYFPGGDPRNFTPDHESCTSEEIERHKATCAEWDAGTGKDVGGPHIPLGDVGHITVAHFGLGVYTYDDPELLKIAQDLDDLIDRIQQRSH